MDQVTIRSALISTDEAFRAAVREVVRPDLGLALAVEVTVPFTQLGDEHIGELRNASPELIFLDLGEDPVVGVRLAQFLADQDPARRFIATGPAMLSPELLLTAMRAGVSEYVPQPVTVEALRTAVEGVVRRFGRAPAAGSPRQPGQILAFFSPKGGSGSTTVATNLAIHLHRLTGKRTLLVDLDLELGEIALQLGVEPRFNFVDMIRNFHRMDAELLASFIERHDSGVHLLSAPYHPDKAEVVTGDQIGRILRFLKEHYDYVIVDTSKSFTPPTLATFEQADRIFLVTNVDLPSLRNIKRCLPLIERIVGTRDDAVRLVVNRHQPNNVITLEDIERTLGMKVYWTIANDYDAVIRSINTGIPIILNGTSKYAQDLKALGAEIAGFGGSTEPERGLLARTFLDPVSRVLRRTMPRNQPEVL